MTAVRDPSQTRFLCPNCEQRMPDTNTAYEETLVRTSTTTSFGTRLRWVATYGHVWLCGPCSAAYQRMAEMRALGHRLQRWGAIGLLGGGVLVGLLLAAVQGEDVAIV